MKAIQFTTYNAYGEFCFYVKKELLQEYLNQDPTVAAIISPEDFKNYYTLEQSRSLFDWIMKRNQN